MAELTFSSLHWAMRDRPGMALIPPKLQKAAVDVTVLPAMLGQESNVGRRDTWAPLTSLNTEAALLLLPETVLERILLATEQKGELRFVCKAFYVTISKSIKDLKLPRGVLRTLDTLAKLRHPLTSLAVLNLSSPLPPPSATTLAYLTSCGLVELQLQDVSIQRATSDGATNLLRSFPQSLERQPMVGSLADSIRTRGAAMVQFARSLPSLRRLSLCNAAFSTSDVAALSALTGLEELSLVGAMECSATLAPACPEATHSQIRTQRPKLLEAMVAVPVHQQLLAALPRLRSLHLPMAISVSHGGWVGGDLSDSDDDDADVDYAGGAGFGGRLRMPVSGNEEASRTREGAVQDFGKGGAQLHLGRESNTQIAVQYQTIELGDMGDGSAETCVCTMDRACRCRWSFPPHLEELTIPLCSLNGPVFRAACEVYGGMDDTYGDDSGGAWAPHRRLRALHITCAPGYTTSQGSFLNAEGDFAVLARLAPSLESLHLCLELGASGRNALRRDRLRGCLRHLKALNKIKDLRIAETQQPTCFAVRKVPGAKQDIISYLLDEPHEAARLCADVRLPPLSLLGNGSYAARPWNGGLLFAQLAVPLPLFALDSTPLSWPCASPGRCLDSLLTHWPLLETLSVCGQCAVRSSSGGRIRLVPLE
ncbi:hypothetical protein VOLCADRAFT_98446 [Volvox carteri f. nagariensis]|uniref:F-box domain-containing protein n=1 Tax=Volvox carteri f. nagariensis TaxID=3068 RepID=D8UFC9_VOLCA|nr:uncharacterized protein VOLCADRAFT_98446 [Volvox carteri f. nagariensis]EFJ41586.1 hypothetical protein VOLCADRAFT_98446 [Volvox carteri f. nagariensis]|eukprot:XP_002957377.1 hypothetical protein VOLCADRAFT_98446 [Volvox carteri f. nagariensis]